MHTTTPTPTELDADTVSALGLDPTGRDLSDRFPYTLENLTDEELLLLLFLSNQAESYPDEAEAPHVGFWYDAVNKETESRFGLDGTENLAAWVTGSHASAEDCLVWVRTNPEHVLAVIGGTS